MFKRSYNGDVHGPNDYDLTELFWKEVKNIHHIFSKLRMILVSVP